MRGIVKRKGQARGGRSDSQQLSFRAQRGICFYFFASEREKQIPRCARIDTQRRVRTLEVHLLDQRIELSSQRGFALLGGGNLVAQPGDLHFLSGQLL
jgi:hypothetical protein